MVANLERFLDSCYVLASYLEDAGEGVAPLVEVLLVVGARVLSGVIVVVLVHSAPFIDPEKLIEDDMVICCNE